MQFRHSAPCALHMVLKSVSIHKQVLFVDLSARVLAVAHHDQI